MDQKLIDKVALEVKRQLANQFTVEIEASGRHVHLSRQDVDQLFGKDYQLTKARELSQPGQFMCEERLTLVGPGGSLQRIAILGPERPVAQVEISQSDARLLGLKPPVRESGDISGTPGIALMSETGLVHLKQGVIIAKRHIHMSLEDAERFALKNQDKVEVVVKSSRSLVFSDVVVRVSDHFATYMHIDHDEANACGFYPGMSGRVQRK